MVKSRPGVMSALIALPFALLALNLGGCHSNKQSVTTSGTLTPSNSADAAKNSDVLGSRVRFVDVAAKAGLNYEWRIASKRPLNILQTIGNGCAFLDYDNDGNLDILLIGPKLGLFHGNGRGRFTDATQASGLSGLSAHFLGCAVGDYDNDGWDDVYVSGYGTGILFHNENGKKFTNATPKVMKPQPWGTSCAWADVDGDGLLDLFVSNYVRFGKEPGIPQLCDSHGVKISCGPRFYKPVKGVLFRNLGQGKFVDGNSLINTESTHGRGLAIAFAPLDKSGRPTLAMANDEMPGDLLSPNVKSGALRYANTGLASGTAFDRDGNVHGGMGADWGDYDNDGFLDLFIATYQNENKSLYRNEGGHVFNDTSYLTGLATPSMQNVAFGCKWLDYDNDGWLDLMFTSGHVQDNVHEVDTTTSYRQKTMLFHNKGGQNRVFENVSSVAGPSFDMPIVGRGLVTGDYDNDGRVDVLIVNSEGKPVLLHNETPATGRWAGVELRGTKSNRDGQGALLTATIGGHKFVRHCQTGGSYLSASDKRVHFGLGAANRIDILTIQWPNGHMDTIKNIPANRYTPIQEGGKLLKEPVTAKMHS